MTSQTGMTMFYCCHHPYHEMVLYLPNARVTIPVLLTLGQLPHVRQPGWGELAGSQRLTQGNLNSLDPSPQHTFLLFRSHEPGFAVLIAVNPHAAHPEPHGRSACLPSLCHPSGAPAAQLDGIGPRAAHVATLAPSTFTERAPGAGSQVVSDSRMRCYVRKCP